MTEPITITIGVPGESDVALVEIEKAARTLGSTVEQTCVLLIGIGLGVLTEEGMVERATAMFRGLDPTPLSDEEIDASRADTD